MQGWRGDRSLHNRFIAACHGKEGMGMFWGMFGRRRAPSPKDAALPEHGELSGAFAHAMLSDLIAERRSERRWRRIKRSLLVIFFALGLLSYVLSWAMITGTGFDFLGSEKSGLIGVITVEGPIGAGKKASADRLIPLIKRAFESKQVAAVVLEIDSPGGSPVEADRVRQYIREARARNPKPVHAVINNVGASAAYMIAIAADQIYASRYSLVGSVGAMMSSWDLHRAMDRYGVDRRTFASGELKAMLDPFQAPTDLAQKKAKSMVDSIGELFVADVVQARSGKLSVDVSQLASGEVWNGAEAAELGLIDGIGSLETLQADLGDAEVKRFGDDGVFGISKAVSRWSAELAGAAANVLAEHAQQIWIH